MACISWWRGHQRKFERTAGGQPEQRDVLSADRAGLQLSARRLPPEEPSCDVQGCHLCAVADGSEGLSYASKWLDFYVCGRHNMLLLPASIARRRLLDSVAEQDQGSEPDEGGDGNSCGSGSEAGTVDTSLFELPLSGLLLAPPEEDAGGTATAAGEGVGEEAWRKEDGGQEGGEEGGSNGRRSAEEAVVGPSPELWAMDEDGSSAAGSDDDGRWQAPLPRPSLELDALGAAAAAVAHQLPGADAVAVAAPATPKAQLQLPEGHSPAATPLPTCAVFSAARRLHPKPATGLLSFDALDDKMDAYSRAPQSPKLRTEEVRCLVDHDCNFLSSDNSGSCSSDEARSASSASTPRRGLHELARLAKLRAFSLDSVDSSSEDADDEGAHEPWAASDDAGNTGVCSPPSTVSSSTPPLSPSNVGCWHSRGLRLHRSSTQNSHVPWSLPGAGGGSDNVGLEYPCAAEDFGLTNPTSTAAFLAPRSIAVVQPGVAKKSHTSWRRRAWRRAASPSGLDAEDWLMSQPKLQATLSDERSTAVEKVAMWNTLAHDARLLER
eukprot:SM000007S20868  [mRNA]  locus=s7:683700:686123:- [translate_table: standard]